MDEEKMLIKSEIAINHIEELDFNFVMILLPNHISDHIHQLGNLITANSVLGQTCRDD